MDITLSAHNVSHYSPGERMEASKARDKTHSELLAGLIDKLKATKEADGSSLFDHPPWPSDQTSAPSIT